MAQIKNSSRQYLVSINKRRSVISLIACIIILVCSVIALDISIIYYVRTSQPIYLHFTYFTSISNMLTALASSFIIPFAVNGIRKKRFILPKWLSMLHYSGTICIAMVLVFMMAFILPYDKASAIGGPNIFLHVINPIVIMFSFFMVESHYDYSKKEVLLCTLPFVIYSLVYIVMVVMIGPENGGWEDLYKANTFAPIYITAPAAFVLVYIIALIIKKISDVLYLKRNEHMLSSWKEEADPIEVNIEVFGLGHYYGIHDDRNSMSIPMDILDLIAERYDMNVVDLYNVYTKGLLNGMKLRKDNRQH